MLSSISPVSEKCHCKKNGPENENWRLVAPEQNLIRKVVPYVFAQLFHLLTLQRFGQIIGFQNKTCYLKSLA
jgi:hypothetical protein